MQSCREYLIKKLILSMLLLSYIIPAAASSSTVQPQLSTFLPGSYETIINRYQGKPFLMVFWSLDCPPCFQELAMLGKLIESHPALNLVLVSTDSPDDRKELLSVINGKGVANAEAWVFSRASSSRLRYEVDRIWYGELPRSYFFDGQQNRQAVSGVLDQEAVELWLREIQ
jgi:thiol-disulfide isomerase/thioredoxin